MKYTRKVARRSSWAILAFVLLGPSLAAETLVVAVRHAEKTASSSDPALSQKGEARAETLARMLADLEIDVIYATPFQRTRRTAAPLAEAKGLEVRTAPIELHAELMAKTIRDSHEGQVVVVVGHSNTTPALAAALGIEDPPEISKSTYDRLFIVRLTADGAHLLPLRYGEGSP